MAIRPEHCVALRHAGLYFCGVVPRWNTSNVAEHHNIDYLKGGSGGPPRISEELNRWRGGPPYPPPSLNTNAILLAYVEYIIL